MSEVELMRQIQVQASAMGHRLFRNNTGVGWAGEQIRVSKPTMVMMRENDVLVRNARPLRAGLVPGSCDLIGLLNGGRFLAVEVKTSRGRLSDHQESFIDMVNRFGGLGIVARTLDDFRV